MIEALLLLILIGVLLCLYWLISPPKGSTSGKQEEMIARLGNVEASHLRIEQGIGEQNRLAREEMSRNLRETREDMQTNLARFQQGVIDTLTKMVDAQNRQFAQLAQTQKEGLEKLSQVLDGRLGALSERINQEARANREELQAGLKAFSEQFSSQIKDLTETQRQKLGEMAAKQDELVKTTEVKLEKMRETVDEKLHKTLEERLGHSFNLVSQQLQEVQKGLGEMQLLATGVGDLKRVLTNVKTRGTLGEIRLESILEQIMAPEQYVKNFQPNKANSEAVVEFAIRLPGQTADQAVYLPIDAKFPSAPYEALQLAYEQGSPEQIDLTAKQLEMAIRKSAKDIADKYLMPPLTTEFGILFLPFEGLYAEVVRRSALVEQLQRDYRIVVTGPTTLAAMLNSLQMGFRTLAIQQRSGEVWKVLGAVKAEFAKFGGILEKAQKKIDEAGKEIDLLVGTRARAIERKLKEVEELPVTDSALLLGTQHLQASPSDDEPKDF